MYELAFPWALLALPLPLLVWWLAPPYRQQVVAVHVPFFERLAAAAGQRPERGAVVLRRTSAQLVLEPLAWALLVLALARPQWIGEPVTHTVSARDLMLAVDISGSMDQPDFKAPDGAMQQRLAAVKHVVGDFVARRQGDRIGLILFGTKAYVQVPFTQDLATATQLLNEAQVAMAGQQTAIGDAIGLTIKAFEASKAEQKVLILLTDGNDTASRVPPAKAAEIARQHGVVVHTIGVGDPNASGENRVDLGALREVASTTGGHFFRAEDAATLGQVYAEIDRLAPAKLQTVSWRPKLPLFHWPLGAAIAVLLALWGWLLLTRRAARAARREPAHA
jgi:Ca-activated chloride channel family protein